MIKSREDYRLYLEADRLALGRGRYTLRAWFWDRVWKYERLLRRVEYYYNCKRTLWGNFVRRVNSVRMHLMNMHMEIPVNTFGPGLSIAHEGCIVVNGNAKIGNNCRIHVDVVIGQGIDADDIPVLGNNVHIGPGVKIIGGVRIGDNTVIAANAAVTKSFPDGNCTIGGVPARIISKNTSLTPSGNQGRGLLIEGYELALKESGR